MKCSMNKSSSLASFSKRHQYASSLSSSSSSWMMVLIMVITVMGMLSLTTAQDLFTESELQSMNDQQLEQICTERGFALVLDEIDPTTGQAYKFTHDDYVVAAQQCLAIEKEMNELLDQHPELAEELEKEIKKMEAEVEARQAEVENLQKEAAEAAAKTNAASSSGTGTAFVPSSSSSSSKSNVVGEDGHQEKNDNDNNKEDYQQMNSILETNDDAAESSSIMDGTETETQSTQTTPQDPLVETDDSSTNNTTKSEEKDEEEAQVKQPEDAAAAEFTEKSKEEDLTLNGMTIEIIKGLIRQAEKDIKLMGELLAPLLQSLMKAGDVAWRHIRALLVSFQEHYNESSSKGKDDDEAQNSVDETVAAA